MNIITDRLILRDYVESDWKDVYAYQSDARYLRYYPWRTRTPDDVKEFLRMFIQGQASSPRIKFQLAITLKTNTELIGSCGLRMESAEAIQGDIGFELSPENWGKGYASEAARAIVDFGFCHLDLHRIWSQCIAENQKSARVLKKLGMTLEGRLRENEYFKGRWWDTLIFGILQDEWLAHKDRQDWQSPEVLH
jgi:RimJ/RimL family protein N-acetyltransferase